MVIHLFNTRNNGIKTQLLHMSKCLITDCKGDNNFKGKIIFNKINFKNVINTYKKFKK